MDEEEKLLVERSALSKFNLPFDFLNPYVARDTLTYFWTIPACIRDMHPDLVLRREYIKKCEESTRRGSINRQRFEALQLHGSAVVSGT